MEFKFAEIVNAVEATIQWWRIGGIEAVHDEVEEGGGATAS
uniref:Uncharacterized protein n=1 Tax=Oryza sativa subsp. japonica TaxID=39947 RepID=Q2QX35_ORYSJ|nr:hypothetical protein LOC_Os12g07328 [Oryza sativa Japonica Group]